MSVFPGYFKTIGSTLYVQCIVKNSLKYENHYEMNKTFCTKQQTDNILDISAILKQIKRYSFNSSNMERTETKCRLPTSGNTFALTKLKLG